MRVELFDVEALHAKEYGQREQYGYEEYDQHECGYATHAPKFTMRMTRIVKYPTKPSGQHTQLHLYFSVHGADHLRQGRFATDRRYLPIFDKYKS